MNNFTKRVLSAAAAVLIALFAGYYSGPLGICLLATVICLFGILEYDKLSLKNINAPPSVRVTFVFFAGLLLVYSTWFDNFILSLWGLSCVTTFFLGLLFLNQKHSLDFILSLFSKVALGFLYVSLLPSFGLRILRLEDGLSWFILLLTIVFTGDVFAYFGGKFWGKKKLMPSVSPSKTQVGAISGLIGSFTGAVFVAHFMRLDVSLIMLGISSVLIGALAQFGDLFESLIKRVAEVKDSGKIMPGHGGALDRLDGVYFAAPAVYLVYELSSRL